MTEIMVNGPDAIFVERAGKLTRWDKTFTSREKLEDVIQQIVGRCNRVVNESECRLWMHGWKMETSVNALS